jgi:hypothetical protein
MKARLPMGPVVTATRYASGNLEHLTRMRDALAPLAPINYDPILCMWVFAVSESVG